jgi:hypothetical protein
MYRRFDKAAPRSGPDQGPDFLMPQHPGEEVTPGSCQLVDQQHYGSQEGENASANGLEILFTVLSASDQIMIFLKLLEPVLA